MLRSTTILLALVCPPPAAAQAPWLQDFAAARERAAAEHKHLLLDFTGSDWCLWCKRLDQEVFSREAFAAAGQQFVLVKLDFPGDPKQLPAAVRQQNAELRERYLVEDYPTILLTDADGRPYARTGYVPGGAAKYLEHLDGLRQRKATFDERSHRARQLQGHERAAALHEALGGLDQMLVLQHYRREIDEVMLLDGDNQAGLKAHWQQALAAQQLQTDIRRLRADADALARAGKWDELLAMLAAAAKPDSGAKPLRQQALFLQGLAQMQGKQDAAAATAALQAAKAVDAGSDLVKQIDRVLDELRKLGAKPAGDPAAGKPGARGDRKQ